MKTFLPKGEIACWEVRTPLMCGKGLISSYAAAEWGEEQSVSAEDRLMLNPFPHTTNQQQMTSKINMQK